MGNLFCIACPPKAIVSRPSKFSAAANSVLLSLLFMVVYGGCSWITAHRSDVGTWYYSWERYIPFVPVLIIPYMSIDLFFVGGPFLCQSRNELRVLAQRITFAILVAGACFLLMWGGYRAGVAQASVSSGGGGLTTGQIHVQILSQLVNPVGYFIVMAAAGAILGGLGYLLAQRKK